MVILIFDSRSCLLFVLLSLTRAITKDTLFVQALVCSYFLYSVADYLGNGNFLYGIMSRKEES